MTAETSFPFSLSLMRAGIEQIPMREEDNLMSPTSATQNAILSTENGTSSGMILIRNANRSENRNHPSIRQWHSTILNQKDSFHSIRDANGGKNRNHYYSVGEGTGTGACRMPTSLNPSIYEALLVVDLIARDERQPRRVRVSLCQRRDYYLTAVFFAFASAAITNATHFT
eukprot:scaffold5989_cov94-Cylindrotheca_fusiformis.AAC.3